MKKLALLVSMISVSFATAQNYYGTEFIGETFFNTPSNLTKSNGKLLLSGFIGGNLTGSFPITFKGGSQDGIVTSLSPTDGSIQWIKQFGGGSNESVIDTAVDSAGNTYVTGFFSGAGATNGMDADPGPGVYTLSVLATIVNRDIFIIKLDPNGDFLWAKQLSSPAGAANDDVFTIKIDSKGDIILGGSYVYIDFDPGTGTQIMTAQNTDAFLLKLTSNGDFVWVKTFPGTSTKRISKIDLDSEDNIYAVGNYQGTIDLNPDPVATDIRTTAGGFDTFVAKYTSAGDYVWASSYGGVGADFGEKLILKDNNIYVSGYFNGTVDLDPSATVNNYTAAAGQDAYISKFTTSGTYLTSMVIPGTTTNLDTIKDIMIDSNNNIYAAGLFQNITIGSNNYTASAANADAFYLKLDSNLNFSSIYLIQGSGIQAVPLIQQLTSTKFLAVGSSTLNADFDYTPNTSTPAPFNPQTYTYLTKFDFEPYVSLGTDASTFNKSKLAIYPNPAEYDINIKSDKKINAAAIFNIEGKRVLTIDKNDIRNINVSLFPKGVYVIQTVDETGNKSQTKFIKK